MHVAHRILETMVYDSCYFFLNSPNIIQYLLTFPSVTEWNDCVWCVIWNLTNLSHNTWFNTIMSAISCSVKKYLMVKFLKGSGMLKSPVCREVELIHPFCKVASWKATETRFCQNVIYLYKKKLKIKLKNTQNYCMKSCKRNILSANPTPLFSAF